MKIRLLADGREGKAGETVDVSPERFAFLMSIEAAEPVKDAREQAEEPAEAAKKKPARKATAKKK